MSASARVRALRDDDWTAVRRIYADGIATGEATFETEVPAVEELDANWIAGHRWVVEEDPSEVLGWAAMKPVSARQCYRGVAETSVYVDPAVSGRGLGRRLLDHQVAAALASGFWTLQTSIFDENTASLRLHRRAGFREVGRRERIAQQNGRWRDTLLLEYRA